MQNTAREQQRRAQQWARNTEIPFPLEVDIYDAAQRHFATVPPGRRVPAQLVADVFHRAAGRTRSVHDAVEFTQEAVEAVIKNAGKQAGREWAKSDAAKTAVAGFFGACFGEELARVALPDDKEGWAGGGGQDAQAAIAPGTAQQLALWLVGDPAELSGLDRGGL